LLIWLSWSACLLGRPDEAVAYGRRAAALAEEVRHPLSQAFALGMGNVVVCLLRREADQIGPPVARLAALVAEYDLAVMVPWRDLFQGVVRATAGDVAAGIRQARRGMARWAEMGATTGRPLQLLLLAQMYERAGEMAAALQTLEKAVTLTEQVGGMIYQAEALRQKGRLLAMQMDDLDGGEAALRAALALAEEQGALWWALRTAVSLVRLQERRGEETPARAIVADIYSRFTEGFATRDLTAARQLFPPGSDVAC
jgi:adenylate cyclase